jgi:predicted DCC family thiol-disulfide oxidoreductase YuxK
MSLERVVLFDGVCNLCNRSVDFLVRHDRAQRLRFAPLQSETGRALLRRTGFDLLVSSTAGGNVAARSLGNRRKRPRTAGREAGAPGSRGASGSGGDPSTIVFVEGDRTHLKSSAGLRLLGALGWPWRIFLMFLLIPRPLRDLGYDWIARNRFRWFGRRDTCRVPSPEERARFLA